MAHRHDKNDCHDDSDDNVSNSQWIHIVLYYFSTLILKMRHPVAINAPRINMGNVISVVFVGTINPRTVDTKRILDISDRYFDNKTI